uniref:Peptidase aspartic putative domain-containing protein n=1 Tax=Plectus sambesii TaxID=2011161 RepID=A0A914WG76_9BILA
MDKENPTQNKTTKVLALMEEIKWEEKDYEREGENIVMKTSTAPQGKNHEVVLLTAKATVRNPTMKPEQGDSVTARIFFDSGSQRSLITQELTDKLKLEKEGEDMLSIYTFASNKPQQMESSTLRVGVILKDGSNQTIQASALRMLTKKLQKKALKDSDFDILQQISSGVLADDIPTENEAIVPDILIGSDYFWELLEPKETLKCPSGLSLIPSKVGLLIGGKQETKEINENSIMYAVLTHLEEEWSFNAIIKQSKMAAMNVEEFWNSETIGIKDSPDTKDGELALQQLHDTIRFENGRYNVKWPWKSKSPLVPENYWLCYGQLKSLTKCFSRESELLEKYDDIIQDQLTKEIIEEVEKETETEPIQHYLPHHPVITPLKTTTKVRIVYDASTKVKKDSYTLNDCLYWGPVMLPDLCGLLLRFRKDPIAMTADIEKAFLQIGLQSADRDVTRFIRLKDPKKPFSSENIQIYQFCRVTFGVISSPYLLSVS